MTDPVIIKDSITIAKAYADVYNVSAIVTESTRETGKTVSVLWNSSSGNTVLQGLLIGAYNALATDSVAVLQAQAKEAIGTDFAVVETVSSSADMTINATNVTVNSGGV